MSLSRQVLIVDESSESREILRTLLERRGVRTLEARRPAQAAELASTHAPDLILFDPECDHSADGTETLDLAATAGRTQTPIVVFGTLPQQGQQIPGGQFVAKPYHYGPLIRKIESLLAAA